MFIAERQGFEPRVPRGTTVFKTAAIDHSATSPKNFLFEKYFLPESGAKVRFYFKTAILLGEKNKKHYIFSLKTTYIPLFKSTLLINYYKKETMQNENPKIIMYICIYNRKNA